MRLDLNKHRRVDRDTGALADTHWIIGTLAALVSVVFAESAKQRDLKVGAMESPVESANRKCPGEDLNLHALAGATTSR